MNTSTAPSSSSVEAVPFLSDAEAQPRLDMLRRYVAAPIPAVENWTDPCPALFEDGAVMIGNKYHVFDVDHLLEQNVHAVLNCASGGISRLPVDEMQSAGIVYEFTNVRQDDLTYPILYDWDTGKASEHLIKAKDLYKRIVMTKEKKGGGKVLFFCVAGQNRSAALAVAVLMLFGHSLEKILKSLSESRPFVLENEGFQRQLIELEHMLKTWASASVKIPRRVYMNAKFHHIAVMFMYKYAESESLDTLQRSSTLENIKLGLVEVELLIPGFCTMDVKITKESSIGAVKNRLIEHANEFLLTHDPSTVTSNNDSGHASFSSKVAKSWMVFAMFGYDDMYDFPLEKEMVELSVQLKLMQEMFGLEVFTPPGTTEQHIRWNSKCRFALVIFSVLRTNVATGETREEPWTFVHKERPGAPATFLQSNLLNTHLRGWDFVTGQAYSSIKPIVFSFSPDSRDKRRFMRISDSANEPVQFHAPGEGGILGIGSNAIVHRVSLGKVVESTRSREPDFMDDCPLEDRWDAAVKRHFNYDKMMTFLENKSEAGLAKRIRLASSLNKDGRIVEFYGLGVGLSSNAMNEHEFKFEAMLLSRYEEEFSTYTMKKFMLDYLDPNHGKALQTKFTLLSVKVLLVSLLNAFRDLTLMGVQAFDFNHLSNVLVSGDYRHCRLIDIDGDSKGSIQLDASTRYIRGSPGSIGVHKPSLDIDLNTVLPTLVEQLVLGKGRGKSFVSNKRSEIWHAEPNKAMSLIMSVLRENFYPDSRGEDNIKAEKHVHKVALWFYAMLKRQPPWGNWTRDIYDAMRCIDHLPIT